RPQVLRVMNAANTGDNLAVGDPLPRGISIVTNLPIYQLGEINTHSVPTGSATDPGVPALLAADAFKLLSKSWDDSRVAWYDPLGISNHKGYITGPPQRTRTAQSTTYNMQVLSGSTPSSMYQYGGGVENFPGLIEEWGGRP